MPDKALLKKSVTRGDYADNPRSGVAFIGVFGGYSVSEGVLPPKPPPYWSKARDYLLRSTVYNETSFWAPAVYIAVTKLAAQSWEVGPDEHKRLVSHSHDILKNADAGRGWVTFIEKSAQDFFLTDNGAFVEIVRTSGARGARIMGIVHLDSGRCWRTGDPDVPVLYTDRMSREHELKAHQVLMLSDMPSPGEEWYGVGMCAASRAYTQIAKLSAVENYAYEKITGNRPQSIYLVNGVSAIQLQQAALSSQQDQARKGAVAFRGAMIIPLLLDKASIDMVEIPLAALPDGWDRKQELDVALLSYANALGLDPQDLQPLGGQQLGAGAQSQILDEKSRGRGQAAYRKQLMHLINEWVLPGAVSMFFIENDLRDQKEQAALDKTRIDTALAMNGGQPLVTAAQAVNWLVDHNVLDKAYMPEGDTTPAVSLDDEEKPEELDEPPADEGADVEMTPAVDVPSDAPETTVTAVKARRGDVGAEIVRRALAKAQQRQRAAMAAVEG